MCLLWGSFSGEENSQIRRELLSNCDATSEREHFTILRSKNDEAFSGHPLADRGLAPYGAFRIERSSWIRVLERMNAVHPCHSPALYEEFTHYIWTFHDSVFECVCVDFEVFLTNGSLASIVPEMKEKFRWASK